MSYRITEAVVQSKLDILNGRLGLENVTYKTVGGLLLYRAQDTAQVQQVSEGGGRNVLFYGNGLRDVANFLDGMLAMSRITEGK